MAPVSSSSQYQAPPTLAQPLAMDPPSPNKYQAPSTIAQPVLIAPEEAR